MSSPNPNPNRRERPAARFEQAVETQAEVALDLLARSVRADSVSGHEDRVTPIFLDWFTERGWAAETMSLAATAAGRDGGEDRVTERANIHGWFGSATGRPVVVINGHIDVVPPGDLAAWTRPAFSGERHGGAVHGRGSVDTKGGIAAAGRSRASVPDRAAMSGRIGVLPGETLESIQAELVATVTAATAGDDWLAVHPPAIRWHHAGAPAWATPVDAPPVTAFTAAQDRHGGRRLAGLTAGCDAGRYATRGIPTVVYGPGDIALAHSVDEYVEETAVVDAAHVLGTALLELSASLETGKDGAS